MAEQIQALLKLDAARPRYHLEAARPFLDAAVKLSEIALRAHPRAARVHCAAGYAFAEARWDKQAATHAEAAYRLDPYDRAILHLVFKTRVWARDYDGAQDVVDDGLAKFPDSLRMKQDQHVIRQVRRGVALREAVDQARRIYPSELKAAAPTS